MLVVVVAEKTTRPGSVKGSGWRTLAFRTLKAVTPPNAIPSDDDPDSGAERRARRPAQVVPCAVQHRPILPRSCGASFRAFDGRSP